MPSICDTLAITHLYLQLDSIHMTLRLKPLASKSLASGIKAYHVSASCKYTLTLYVRYVFVTFLFYHLSNAYCRKSLKLSYKTIILPLKVSVSIINPSPLIRIRTSSLNMSKGNYLRLK